MQIGGLAGRPGNTSAAPGVSFPLARDALADLVTDQEVRGVGIPLPTAGYEEHWLIGSDARSYVYRSGGTVLTVVDVEQVDRAWQVIGWEAARC